MIIKAIVEDDSKGLTDQSGVAFVEKLKEDSNADIYPATVQEFNEFLTRGKITALRTLVRTVFSCPKTLAHSFKLDITEEADCILNHDWDGLVREVQK